MNLHGKKVLVTGAGGFIGSHLVELLLKEGADVLAFIKYSSSGNIHNLEWIKRNTSNFNIIYGDIRDYGSVYNAIKRCQIVFHLSQLSWSG